MGYQVLARKWRPQAFASLVGQEHVVRALSNALSQDRLHHAYLFTGTRGVGKTTVARIFAKCLNCETGIVAEPCGTCSACREITEGRFVDLIEIDAASRTKVEDMRELLDNVQYRPTRARFKVYLIDEVHMLSTSSFNALLKTLEEPPEHVKFLLATTDPQKLPVTVLSRCLQFNLKVLSSEKIVHHLQDLLQQERVAFEEGALWEIARAAEGSMRDALSLTDQAIAFGNATLRTEEVADMLGTVDRQRVWHLLESVLAEDRPGTLTRARDLAAFAPDYHDVLQAMAEGLYRIALEQTVPGVTDNAQGDRARVVELAGVHSAEAIQLLYQIALLCRRDLSLAPEPRIGFEMALLRMLAFLPESGGSEPAGKSKPAPPAPPRRSTPPTDVPREINAAVTPDAIAEPSRPTPSAEDLPPWELSPESPVMPTAPVSTSGVSSLPVPEAEPMRPSLAVAGDRPMQTATDEPAERPAVELVDEAVEKGSGVTRTAASAPLAEQWPALLQKLPATGILRAILLNTVLVELSDTQAVLEVDHSQQGIFNAGHQARAEAVFSQYYGRPVKVEMRLAELSALTPHQQAVKAQEAAQRAAEDAIAGDPNVNWLLARFGGAIVPNSIQPRGGK